MPKTIIIPHDCFYIIDDIPKMNGPTMKTVSRSYNNTPPPCKEPTRKFAVVPFKHKITIIITQPNKLNFAGIFLVRVDLRNRISLQSLFAETSFFDMILSFPLQDLQLLSLGKFHAT